MASQQEQCRKGDAAQGKVTTQDPPRSGFRHNVLNLSQLKERGLSFKVEKPKGPEPQLRRTGYEKF